MDERNRFVRGLVAWVGFRSTGVEHEREERFAGKSKAQSIGVLQLAVKAIFAHSQVPLVIIPLVGVGLFVSSIIALIALTIDWATRGVPFPGFGTIVALMVMLFGILFCLLGIVSFYIGLIYEEVKGRPNFIIRQTLGLGGPLALSDTPEFVSSDESEMRKSGAGRVVGRLSSEHQRDETPPNGLMADRNTGDLVERKLPDQHS